MKMKFISAIALLWSICDLALAQNCVHSSSWQCPVPEIDGALSIQAVSLLVGVLYLLKRKK